MDTLTAFANGLVQFLMQAAVLIIKFFIYIFTFLISLLQQLLGLVS